MKRTCAWLPLAALLLVIPRPSLADEAAGVVDELSETARKIRARYAGGEVRSGDALLAAVYQRAYSMELPVETWRTPDQFGSPAARRQHEESLERKVDRYYSEGRLDLGDAIDLTASTRAQFELMRFYYLDGAGFRADASALLLCALDVL